MLRITLRSANRRTARSLEVNPPSLKTGWVNRFVVAVVTTSPVSASPVRNRSRMASRAASSEPNGIRSSSWKFTPYAPSSASFSRAWTGSIAGRVASPKGSRPCQPTVHRPKEKWSSGVGVGMLMRLPLGRCWYGCWCWFGSVARVVGHDHGAVRSRRSAYAARTAGAAARAASSATRTEVGPAGQSGGASVPARAQAA